MDTSRGKLLADLVMEHKGARSYEDLSRLAGGAITRGRWQQLATVRTQTQFPEARTIRGIALAFGISQREVIHAAARSVGLDP
jgi:hypothetical protein